MLNCPLIRLELSISLKSKQKNNNNKMEISKSNVYYLYLILLLLLNKLTDGLEDEKVNDDDDDETYDEDPVDLFVEPVKTGDDLANFQHTLLANYDPDTRPVINSQDPIKVFMRATIVQINNLDEIYQVSHPFPFPDF